MTSIRRAIRWTAVVAVAALWIPAAAGPGALAADPAPAVGEKLLLDNARVMVFEYTFPGGFRGEEHAAVADEFAYVLDGQFTVVTRGQRPRVVRPGEIEYAAKGTVHTSLNEAASPARVLVVLVKER